MKMHELAKILLWADVRDIEVPNDVENKVISLVPLRHRELGIGFPKLFSLRCYDKKEQKLFQSWEFTDYLEFGDTLTHIFSDGIAMSGCKFTAVAIYSGGFELTLWEREYV